MISAIVLTKNEEQNIRQCLKALDWCSEVIIVDDYSTDLTIRKIEKQKMVKVFKRNLSNDFAAQRNFGLSKVKGDWVLFVDADERISTFLKKEILENLNKNNFDGFYLKRRDYFLGKEMKYGETGKIKLLRLARKKSGKWKRKVHEYWEVNGKIGELKNPILHYSHLKLSDFIIDINNYSTIHAGENFKEKKKGNFWKIIVFPLLKFIMNYFCKYGFLDGVEGFIMAIIMSFHSFLSWSKLWMN